MKTLIVLSLLLSLPALANPYRDPDQALKTELNKKLLGTATVLAKGIADGKSCALYTTRHEVMGLVKRVERNAAPRTLDENTRLSIVEDQALQRAMKDYLSWQLYVARIELNRYEPLPDFAKIKKLLETTSSFRPAMRAAFGPQLPFHELRLLPGGRAQVETVTADNRLDKREARWEFGVRRKDSLLRATVMVHFENRNFAFTLEETEYGAALHHSAEGGLPEPGRPDSTTVFAQDQFGCLL